MIHESHAHRTLFSLHVERRSKASILASSISAGDPSAIATAATIHYWLSTYQSGRIAHCLACDRRLRRRPDALVVARMLDDSGAGFAGGLCPACTKLDDDEILGEILAFLRETVVPDARRIDPVHFAPHGGRA
jgi:hypothetical protein